MTLSNRENTNIISSETFKKNFNDINYKEQQVNQSLLIYMH